MFSKFVAIAATGIAVANAACTNPTQFPNNPVTAPDTLTYPTIGMPFNIEWDNTNMGPTVTLLLLDGCPSNCVVVETIVAGASNTGSYSWTPDCSLTADTTAEAYGIQMIDDTLCEFQWSNHFGLHPGTCNAPTTTPTSTTTTTQPTSTPSSTTTTTTQAPPVSKSYSASASGSAPPYPTGGSGGNGGYSNGTATTSTAGPTQTGQYVSGAADKAVSALGGVIALFAAALIL